MSKYPAINITKEFNASFNVSLDFGGFLIKMNNKIIIQNMSIKVQPVKKA